MRWVLDSNVWIEAAAGITHAANALSKGTATDWCGFSAVTRLEVFGFPNLTPLDEKRLQVLFAQFHEVPVSTDIIDKAIQLRKQVRIKTPDAIIAATALVQNANLITRNVGDFQKIPGLSVTDSTTL